MIKRYKNENRTINEIVSIFDLEVCGKCLLNNECFKEKKLPKRSIYSNTVETVISCNSFKKI